MTPEEKSLLERTYKLTEENNALLRKMQRRALFGTVFRVIYWALIIGISIGAFYFIQPYIDTLMGVYGQVQDTSILDLFKGSN